MSAVTFELVDDQQHFRWGHTCTPLDVSHLDAEAAAWYRAQRAKPRELSLGADGWHLVQIDPLTIVPSILCGTCGLHGFITNGEWVPA